MSQKIEGSLPPPAVRSTTQVGRTAPAAAGADRSEPVEATRAGDSLRLTGEATGLQALQRELSTAPAIDAQRVAEVRQALENGTYKIDPARIADRMIEMDRQFG
ncbi:Anti-sigma-28 factor FlgM family protein [Pseudoxanthomonas suwonensis 11-1]|uniref:Negative regulator of flagellin synthesis n=1 Tax=Pseudoxanthomonas suwonensis (strain 11-1) TaxID=743721 RepID=E6WST4_PSEUU|nr:flagellar biosynthesis anti-sigma factor FlgM [Pseudoxanthomonas suwonensis]ADV27371.1 Anti-sigma-28 factor FlgM family protein [Pseudoxanthomonas suwonensis 11-1]